MRGQRFRLNTTTLAIMVQDGHNIPIMVPQGAIVEVEAGPLDGTRLVDVTWEHTTLMMFTIDLRQRGARIDGESV